MRSVIATLEQAIVLLREEGPKKPYALTEESKQLVQLMHQSGRLQPSVEVAGEEFFGYPGGTRIFYAQTPFMLQLIIVNVDGKYKIVWTEVGQGK